MRRITGSMRCRSIPLYQVVLPINPQLRVLGISLLALHRVTHNHRHLVTPTRTSWAVIVAHIVLPVPIHERRHFLAQTLTRDMTKYQRHIIGLIPRDPTGQEVAQRLARRVLVRHGR